MGYFLCAVCGALANPKMKGGGPSLRIVGSHDCRGTFKAALRKAFAPAAPATATRSAPARRSRIARLVMAARALVAAVIAFFTTDRVLRPA